MQLTAPNIKRSWVGKWSTSAPSSGIDKINSESVGSPNTSAFTRSVRVTTHPSLSARSNCIGVKPVALASFAGLNSITHLQICVNIHHRTFRDQSSKREPAFTIQQKVMRHATHILPDGGPAAAGNVKTSVLSNSWLSLSLKRRSTGYVPEVNVKYCFHMHGRALFMIPRSRNINARSIPPAIARHQA